MIKQKDEGSGVSELRGSWGIDGKGKESMSRSGMKGLEEKKRSWNKVVIVTDKVVSGVSLAWRDWGTGKGQVLWGWDVGLLRLPSTKGIATPGWDPESSQNVDKQLGRLLVIAARRHSVNQGGGILQMWRWRSYALEMAVGSKGNAETLPGSEGPRKWEMQSLCLRDRKSLEGSGEMGEARSLSRPGCSESNQGCICRRIVCTQRNGVV